MNEVWRLDEVTLGRLTRIAELLALIVRPGDAVILRGDLGAGKTTFARGLIRALLGDADAEVPSPTFPVVQTYPTPRLAVAHFDFYRLAGESELVEIGFDDALAGGLVLVEWPERASDQIASLTDRLEIGLAAGKDALTRGLTLTGHGTFAPRLARMRQKLEFLAAARTDFDCTAVGYMQGDASTRAYARIAGPQGAHVLMDAPRMPDGPPVAGGRPYSRIAHLAEDVRPFVAVGHALAAAGLSAPHILRADLEQGFVLLEDLGRNTFAHALASGVDQRTLWLAAVDALVHLRLNPIAESLPLPDGGTHRLPRFDRAALEIELGLLLDWYWPHVKGEPAPDMVRGEMAALWSPVLEAMLGATPGVFLRDYHSPNLFWLPDCDGIRRVGVIDFQDALAEHWAYDLASLLQDARIDVPAALEAEGLARYCAAVAAAERDFDEAAFRAAYAAFGAQRNTRLIGLWVRLKQRDGKPGYMQHLPRTWSYLGRNLVHPSLAGLRPWYERHFGKWK